jgi:hypothetical protein
MSRVDERRHGCHPMNAKLLRCMHMRTCTWKDLMLLGTERKLEKKKNWINTTSEMCAHLLTEVLLHPLPFFFLSFIPPVEGTYYWYPYLIDKETSL